VEVTPDAVPASGEGEEGEGNRDGDVDPDLSDIDFMLR